MKSATVEAMGGPAPGAGYAEVNGLKMYYEVRGSGRPLVLLHGGVGASEMFGAMPVRLAEGRQVITVHLQAHGRTGDIDRPLRFELLADDVAALLERLGVEEADLMGHSLGGGVALQLAIRRPEAVRRLVTVSTPFRREGWYPEVLEGMAQMSAESSKGMEQSPLYQLYPNVDWAALFTKLGELLGRDYDWSEDVAAIEAPIMMAFADADAVRPAHVLELFALFGGGQRDAGMDGSGRPRARLAVLPGMTHYTVLSYPLLDIMVSRFLDEDLP